MYKKGVAVELQFPATRLNKVPLESVTHRLLLSLDVEEARALFERLKIRLTAGPTAPPMIVSLDATAGLPSSPATPDLQEKSHASTEATEFKQWICVICGWLYDEEAGLPEEGIAPGTRFADIAEDWRCLLCDVGKEDFVVVEF